MSVIEFPQESCCGCDAVAPQHPYVAVMQDASGSFIYQPVCEQCWAVPTTRKRVIKAHFFPRAQRESAVAAAGSSTIG